MTSKAAELSEFLVRHLRHLQLEPYVGVDENNTHIITIGSRREVLCSLSGKEDNYHAQAEQVKNRLGWTWVGTDKKWQFVHKQDVTRPLIVPKENIQVPRTPLQAEVKISESLTTCEWCGVHGARRRFKDPALCKKCLAITLESFQFTLPKKLKIPIQ